MRYLLTALLISTAVACSTPSAEQASGQPAQTAKGPSKPVATLPDGWKVRLDDAAAKPEAVGLTVEKNAVVIAAGPAAIYYKPDLKAEKDYNVSATLSQLKTVTPPQPYGLLIAGADLDKDTARYTVFLIRGDGKFQIATGGSAGTLLPIVDWTSARPMMEPKGVKTSNTLAIRAMQGALHFFVNEKEVHQMPRERAGADGLAGVRVGQGLNVQVTRLEVKKFP